MCFEYVKFCLEIVLGTNHGQQRRVKVGGRISLKFFKLSDFAIFSPQTKSILTTSTKTKYR